MTALLVHFDSNIENGWKPGGRKLILLSFHSPSSPSVLVSYPSITLLSKQALLNLVLRTSSVISRPTFD